jgi:hypothetical protein
MNSIIVLFFYNYYIIKLEICICTTEAPTTASPAMEVRNTAAATTYYCITYCRSFYNCSTTIEAPTTEAHTTEAPTHN